MDLVKILKQIEDLSKKYNCINRILWSPKPLSGVVPSSYVLGIDYTLGNLYYKNATGQWEKFPFDDIPVTLYTGSGTLSGNTTVGQAFGGGKDLTFLVHNFNVSGYGGVNINSVFGTMGLTSALDMTLSTGPANDIYFETRALRFDLTAPVYLNGDTGINGYIFTSGGPGVAPTWSPNSSAVGLGGVLTITGDATSQAAYNLSYINLDNGTELNRNNLIIYNTGTIPVTIDPAYASSGRTFFLPNISGVPIMTINGNTPNHAGAISISLDLQAVTDAGSTTSNPIIEDDGGGNSGSFSPYQLDYGPEVYISGLTQTIKAPLILGSSTVAAGHSGSAGTLQVDNIGGFHGQFKSTNITATRVLQFPNNSGTIALTSDIVPPSLTNTYIGVGNGSNLLGGSSFFTQTLGGGGYPRINIGIPSTDPSLITQSTFLVTDDSHAAELGIQCSASNVGAYLMLGNDNHTGFLGLNGSGFGSNFGGTSLSKSDALWLYGVGHQIAIQGEDILLGKMGGTDYNLEIAPTGIYIGKGTTIPHVPINALEVNGPTLLGNGTPYDIGGYTLAVTSSGQTEIELSSTDATREAGLYMRVGSSTSSFFKYGLSVGGNIQGAIPFAASLVLTNNQDTVLQNGNGYNGYLISGGPGTDIGLQKSTTGIYIGPQSTFPYTIPSTFQFGVNGKAFIGTGVTLDPSPYGSSLLVSDNSVSSGGEPTISIATNVSNDRAQLFISTDGADGGFSNAQLRRFGRSYGGTSGATNIPYSNAFIIDNQNNGFGGDSSKIYLTAQNLLIGYNNSAFNIGLGITSSGVVVDQMGNIYGETPRNSSQFDVYGLINSDSIISSGNVLIGTTTPDTSALLKIDSTTKGFLPPRMTTTQRNAITATEGLIVYDTNIKTPFFFNGTSWIGM